MTQAARERKKKRRAVTGQAYEKPARAARRAARGHRNEERTSKLRHLRAEVALRSAGKCEWCQHRKVGELHHVVSGGGKRRRSERLDTLAATCTPCHQGFHAGDRFVMEDALTWSLLHGFDEAFTEIHRRLHKAKRALPRGRT